MPAANIAARWLARDNAAYVALLGLAVVDAAGYSIIAPVAPAIATAAHAGPALVGALVASFPLVMVLGFALAGGVVARREPTVLISCALVLIAAGSVGFATDDRLAVWFASRTLMGLGSGGLWIGITFATLSRWPGQEYVCMSRVFAAYALGGLVGPAIRAVGGVHRPFLVYLGLIVSSVTFVAPLARTPIARFVQDRGALRLPGFWIASGAIAFVVFALGTLEGVLPLHFARHLDQTQIGVTYALVAIVVTMRRLPPVICAREALSYSRSCSSSPVSQRLAGPTVLCGGRLP